MKIAIKYYTEIKPNTPLKVVANMRAYIVNKGNKVYLVEVI